jgi:hypothetical protein
VWIGTPITASYLRPIISTLTALQQKHPDLRIRLVGAGNGLRDVLPFAEVVEWSEANEAKLLAECDVGLMPLPDNEFTRGKCGLKLIQYMAAGLPVVGSPVGANRDIISEGKDGLFAGEPHQWFTSLELLIGREDLRREFGCSGVEKVTRFYSLQRGFDDWMSILEPLRRGHFGNDRTAVTVPGPIRMPALPWAIVVFPLSTSRLRVTSPCHPAQAASSSYLTARSTTTSTFWMS